MSSDTCRSLKYPYVTVTLKVADPSGQITDKSFEMTIPQFQVCNQCLLIWSLESNGGGVLKEQLYALMHTCVLFIY